MALIVTPDLVARAEAVLHPWSGATTEERQKARMILREAAKQRLWERVTAADEFRGS